MDAGRRGNRTRGSPDADVEGRRCQGSPGTHSPRGLDGQTRGLGSRAQGCRQVDADSRVRRLPARIGRRAVVSRRPCDGNLPGHFRSATPDHRRRYSRADLASARAMKRYLPILALVGLAACSGVESARTDDGGSSAGRLARNVTIIRDNWGIPHVFGKSDADAVFGVIYAQAEDDFNRVETNYLNALGRLAEAEGEAQIFRDLRMKLFIDSDELRAKYRESPGWLQTLMTAWADGLNYYLSTHPNVKPRVITKFEPWMALAFSEG